MLLYLASSISDDSAISVLVGSITFGHQSSKGTSSRSTMRGSYQKTFIPIETLKVPETTSTSWCGAVRRCQTMVPMRERWGWG